ncbi:type IV pilus modification protein PilV [Aquabacterium sp. A7-Y]|uniref:type IV pilus modification protein PilV n=1 Tax=Aquabacterium sp. A7-Y TaxID=1349605 RepID=UPI00223CBC3E|nr:type IV pilus modification protein PilV [Aquabacterium sp. A7-Y]MCW7539177.1 type IV pilus modification protein PilV [Aquabacterium sp. A7-Y]
MHQPPKKTASGVTLIEVLVSLLILSLGLLGVLGLQAQSVRFQVGSASRASLSVALSDISDRLRSNLSMVPGYDMTVTNSPYSYTATWTAQDEVDEVTRDCSTTTCTPTQRATYDIEAWRNHVRTLMPRGSVNLSGNLNTGMNVTLMWFDKDFLSGGELQSAPVCPTAPEDDDDNRMLRQSCCPTAVAAPAGVRCANFTVFP